MWTGPNDAPLSTKEERMVDLGKIRFFDSGAPLPASRLMMFLARVFGKKRVSVENKVTVTSYMFRGILYVTKIDVEEA